jgi:hypothetical protein
MALVGRDAEHEIHDFLHLATRHDLHLHFSMYMIHLHSTTGFEHSAPTSKARLKFFYVSTFIMEQISTDRLAIKKKSFGFLRKSRRSKLAPRGNGT